MIRLYCQDGPHAGQTYERPEGHQGTPTLILLTAPGGLYLATARNRDTDLRWVASWLPVVENTAVAA